MLVLGLGLGLVMQVLVLVVQNEIDYADLGVATSGVTLFRLIGGSLGTALMGAIFASRLASNLASAYRPEASGAGSDGESQSDNGSAIAGLRQAAVLRCIHGCNQSCLPDCCRDSGGRICAELATP